MANASLLENVTEIAAARLRPVVRSFDSGYEHSPEHLAAVRRMVEEDNSSDEPSTPSWLYAIGVKA